MTKEELEWFDKLTKDREGSANTHEKISEAGYWRSVVDKYSEEAHFIYELLQNADDCKATEAHFELTKDGLFFFHNGNVKFSISNAENEFIDTRKKKLGHINSICSVGNSTKTEQKIGKFGLGFKSVFQFTQTPYIFDSDFQFKIERFIVPNILDEKEKVIFEKFQDKEDKTIFWFPFNHKEKVDEQYFETIDLNILENQKEYIYHFTWQGKQKTKSIAYQNIFGKLKELVHPTLFLTNLKTISWKLPEQDKGKYEIEVKEEIEKGDITFKKIKSNNVNLILFSKNCSDKNHSYSISIGFTTDEKYVKLIPKGNLVGVDAFCFFPAISEKTELNFLINAPFLLTDDRERIDKKESSLEFNQLCITQLAQLAADSMLILKELKLIDDDIIKIIPYKKPAENDFFAPFYKTIKEKFQTEEILPTKDGTYTKKENAYWADYIPITETFSNEQLTSLLNNNTNAKWVFTKIGRNDTKYKGNEAELGKYIDDLINKHFDLEYILKNYITLDFIQNQSFDWLHQFYAHVNRSNDYIKLVKTKPIFRDIQGNTVAAFEKNNEELHCILFLPLEDASSTYNTIHPELLNNENTIEFLKNFGIHKPDLRDEIYRIIRENHDISHFFSKIFNYWKNAGQPEDLISQMKSKVFVSYNIKNNEETFREKAKEIYYPTPDLLKYFESKPDTKFVNLKHYYDFFTDEKEREVLKEFLLKLGVSILPRIFERKITDSTEKQKLNLKPSTNGYDDNNTTTDKIIDGSKEILEKIDNEKSFLLWHFLKKLPTNEYSQGSHKYFSYSQYYQSFEATTLTLLKTKKWLLSNNNEFVAPNKITINELADDYERNAELERLLGFKPTVILTETERIAQKFESEEEAELAKRLLDEYKTRQNPTTANIGNNRNSNNTDSNLGDENSEEPKKSKIERTIKDLGDLQNEFTPKQKDEKKERLETQSKPEIKFEEDEEFAKGIEDLKKQLEIKKSRVDLAENINNSVKYSYDWFKAYLQLLTTYGEKQDTQKQKSISFQEIKPYKADNKYFLLCGASSYISPEIENANDIKVSLILGKGKRENISVEGVSKKGQDLLIYCPKGLDVDISKIFKVEINFTPVIDLLDRLYKAFTNDKYIKKEWKNIQEAMPSLNYIYGPPGTGKTTTICNNILAENPNTKFLVLTPTNKAADVVCKKLLVENPNINAIRLSRPTDPELEEYQVYRDILHNDDMGNINVVASTIHRLPYFEIQEIGFLFQYQWDYVIFDEASMTGLHYITFAIMALFKTNPNTNFIIAGDPKQIPPVIEIDEKELENFDFQDENIYKMMSLESFNPEEQIIRKNDTIQNLDTQFRSIPQIGQLFSKLSYSSLLNHDRETNNKESKQLPEEFKNLISSNVTFIDIPLNQDNSIYKVNKLFYSSYHIYSAILVSEIIKYFDSLNKDKQWTIGLIAPYKAQAILLNKLITSYGISENIKVFSDTVHGFQGDECDIVFFVCNPNNYHYSGHEKALLSKEYIYNVAISRAKDYLIILHPYTAIKNNSFINNFGDTEITNAKDIEKILFKDENYIENNSFVSGHDNINVFGLSEMKYFIKAGDTAIDIQLRDIKKNDLTNQNEQIDNNFLETSSPKLQGLKILGKIDLP